jgi:DNA-binding NarL/FixJ family response regulator
VTQRATGGPAGDESVPPGGLPGTETARASGGEMRILVVEDDWMIAMEIEAALADAGFTVLGTAASADAAVAMAITRRPDLVLMDIRLEGLRDGIDAAGEIYERLGTRCLFISANADPSTRRRAESTHPLGWLPKPFSSRQLVAAVRALASG